MYVVGTRYTYLCSDISIYTIICILEVPIFFKMSDKIYIDISIQYGIEIDTCIHLELVKDVGSIFLSLIVQFA